MPLEVDFESSAHIFRADSLVQLLDEACTLAIGRSIVEKFTHVRRRHLVAYRVAGTESLSANSPILILKKSNPGRLIKMG